jgi:hypothetical protein
MNADGDADTAPCDSTAPVAEVSRRSVAIDPVANAAVESGPVIPDVMESAPETES